MTYSQPVIVIGMHRSGTSILSRVLERAGLFLGWKKEENNESSFFIRLNDWLIRELGGSWDVPDAVSSINEHSRDHINAIIKYLSDQLNSPRSLEYLGPLQYVKTMSILKQHNVWGWKDPRNTLTLDLWLKLFPKAKVVHIVRNGIDVAQSLRVRNNRYLYKNIAAYNQRRLLYALLGKRGKFVDSARTFNLENGFSIWEHYVDQARSYRRNLGQRYLEVKYEDLLTAPQENVHKLMVHSGLPNSEGIMKYVLEHFESKKSYAFVNNYELCEFAKTVEQRLATRGYIL